MLASEVELNSLHDYDGIMETIRAIEADWRNYDCTRKQWFSGAVNTELKAGAKQKIKALEARAERLFPCVD